MNPLFLTSRVELAAFDDRIDVPFVVLDDIVEMLQDEIPPVNGLFVPKWARRLLGWPWTDGEVYWSGEGRSGPNGKWYRP